jgi:hypothetical protein
MAASLANVPYTSIKWGIAAHAVIDGELRSVVKISPLSLFFSFILRKNTALNELLF